MTSPPSVGLIEWNWFGHIPAWYAFYCAALLRLGCKVEACCPQPEETRSRLEASGLVSASDLERLTTRRFSGIRTPLIRPARFQTLLDDFLWRRSLRRLLAGRHYDLVFFSCLHEDIAIAARRWKNLGAPAAAFLVNATGPQSPAPRISFSDLDTFAVLDGQWASSYRTAYPAARFVTFPDIAIPAAPAQDGLALRVRSLAAGRPVVLLPGMLSPYKGIVSFARLASHPALAGCFFVLAGELPRDQFSPAELAKILHLENSPDRALTIFQRISDESYDALIAESSVLFAVYENFRKSSNTLTRAALFEKPVLVAEGGIMADRTREFRLGEIVPPRDLEAAAAAILSLAANPAAWALSTRPRWADYRAVHDFARLVSAFRDILA